VGFRFYKSVRLGSGARLNLSRGGFGVSFGVPGLRYSVHSSGRGSASASLRGTGVSYRTTSEGAKRKATNRRTQRAASGSGVGPLPKAGRFAPKSEKAFVNGVARYMEGRYPAALEAFEQSMERDPGRHHIAEEYFAAFCLVALGRNKEAANMLEDVLGSAVDLPDDLMRKYGIGGTAFVTVTPNVVAQIPHGNLAAGLLLAELYQVAGRADEAAEVLETFGAVAPHPLFALSLADLYNELGQRDPILRVTDDYVTNTDDPTAQLLVYRARAFGEKGMHVTALETLKEALKSRKRNPEILKQARYERGLIYEEMGSESKARAEFEKLYAADPNFADVASRVGMRGSP
jgi:tetratricopeptide (TPR) repeat protein